MILLAPRIKQVENKYYLVSFKCLEKIKIVKNVRIIPYSNV